MKRARLVLGLIAGVVLIVSSGAHSFLGWKNLSDRLAVAQVPSDLQIGLKIGWQFAGAAMLVLGVIVIAIFAGRLRGQRPSLMPAVAVCILYLAFGAWALAASGGDLFFMIFIVPGAMLGIAANGQER
jgi:hypothetical protein